MSFGKWYSDLIEDCPWDNGELGRDEKFVKVVDETNLQNPLITRIPPVDVSKYDDWEVI